MLDADTPADDFITTQDRSDGPTDPPATEGAAEGAAADPVEKTAKKATKKAAKTTAKPAAKKTAKTSKAATKKSTAKASKETAEDVRTPATSEDPTTSGTPGAADVPESEAKPSRTSKKAAAKAPAKKTTAKRTGKKAAAAEPAAAGEPTDAPAAEEKSAAPAPAASLLFQPPDPAKATTTKRRSTKKAAPAPDGGTGDDTAADAADDTTDTTDTTETTEDKRGDRSGARRSARRSDRGAGTSSGQGAGAGADHPSDEGGDQGGDKRSEAGEAADEDSSDEPGGRRRRRRGGRRRRKSGESGDADSGQQQSGDEDDDSNADSDDSSASGSRRRRRRRRAGDEENGASDDPRNTVTRVRKARNPEDEITALSGSTRLEAKKQRRREGREAGRRRAPIVSEAEFLARRESVDRKMVIRQRKDLTQIAVLEDKVLVEHYVARESQTSLIGNVYLGRVQNVLPSMEAAFIDIGKGRNAVIYAGEVNWSALGAKENQPRKIESVLKSGQQILVQVTKDPVGHKGARLTSQISLPGRFLVYVPDGTTSGISRKLPDTERNRLKALLKEIVPESAGVIVRTAAEGASEEELTRDVTRLTSRWEDIEKKVKAGNAPQLLYGEPDLTLKVVRDLFTEDFGTLVVEGDDAWEMVRDYVDHVAPDLGDRLERYDASERDGRDVFVEHRIDEQIAKALDRKVWLPSGGSLIIDRTEAMTVVDVNTGKFTGSGGNLEETVTKNNLEAAEELVRQLRLRDIGGIIVVDFIDMVLESNRDLVLRRMVECLGRDRTRHQVAEVTSLGLVQMTRKRIGTGLLEAFTESCEHCQGRGLLVHHEPVEPQGKSDEDSRRGGGRSRGKGRGGKSDGSQQDTKSGQGGQKGRGGDDQRPAPDDHAHKPSPSDFAAMARREEGQTDGVRPADADSDPGADSDSGTDSRSGADSDTRTRVAAKPDDGGSGGADDQPVKRSRKRGGRGSGRSGSGDQTPTGDSAAEQTKPPTASPPKPDAESVTEAPAAEPVVPAAPRSSTRRRSARRPQGPAGDAVEVAADQSGAQSEAQSGAQPGAQSGAQGTVETVTTAAGSPGRAAADGTEEPTAPRVATTTTRRRTARRAAGPPAAEPTDQ